MRQRLTQTHPDDLPPPDDARGPVTAHLESRVRKVHLQRRRKERPSSHRRQVLLSAARTLSAHQISCRPPLARTITRHGRYLARSDFSSVPGRSKAWSASCSSLAESPRCSLMTASARSRSRSSSEGTSAGSAEIGEPGIGIVVRALLPAMHRTQPHDAVLLVHPGGRALRREPQPVDQWLADREYAFLALSDIGAILRSSSSQG